MSLILDESRPAASEEVGSGSQPGVGALFLTTLWFGLLTGWLEIGLVLSRAAVYPHVCVDTLRTNRHLVWMVPTSDALIFAIVAIPLALLAGFRRDLARWVALRVSVGMSSLGLLLNVEGLYAVASLILACGLSSVAGPWLERRAERFGRLVRVSFPAMAVGLVVLTGLTYHWITTSERRALSVCPPAKPGAPNVLLIVLDTVRASCLSLYGHNRPTTPNLERLASRGIVFTEARSTAPWTSPAHGSLLTGRWPHELSVGPRVPLDGTFPTLAEVLERQGYATAGFVGNIYYCNALYGFGRGFARYEDAYENQTVSLFETAWSSGLVKRGLRAMGYSMHLDDGVTLLRKTAEMLNRDVLSWLDGLPAGRPFFGFINYYDAHRPHVLPGRPELRFGLAALADDDQSEIHRRFEALAGGEPAPFDHVQKQICEDRLELIHDSYDSCIAYLDSQLGLLIDEIERRGQLENTLVIVTSDHGEHLGERGLIAHGASVYRPEVHVPLVVIPPARSMTARVVHEPVSIREIPATVAEWVDLGTRNPFPGRSLNRFASGVTSRASEVSPVLCELQHNIAFPGTDPIPYPFGPASSLVTRDRVYIRREDGSEELYDPLSDPEESVNLASDPRSRPVLDRFREELSQLRRDVSTSRR